MIKTNTITLSYYKSMIIPVYSMKLIKYSHNIKHLKLSIFNFKRILLFYLVYSEFFEDK